MLNIYTYTPKNHVWCFNLNISWSNHPQPWRGSLIFYFFPMENHHRQQHKKNLVPKIDHEIMS